MHERSLSELEQQGFIKAFAFTHELAWNTLKSKHAYGQTTAAQIAVATLASYLAEFGNLEQRLEALQQEAP